MRTEDAMRKPAALSVGFGVMPARGDFIRVKSDHENPARAGLDGMVMETADDADDGVALVFWSDRQNEIQRTECVGPEWWEWRELDPTSLCGRSRP